MARIRDFVTALRSGEYAQGREQLSRTDAETGEVTYCCEGVALERYGSALGYEVTRTQSGALHGRDPELVYGGGSTLTAPMRFWRDMGMLVSDASSFRIDVSSRDGKDFVFYSDMNDNGFTFPQIADLIEWQFLSGREKQGE